MVDILPLIEVQSAILEFHCIRDHMIFTVFIETIVLFRVNGVKDSTVQSRTRFIQGQLAFCSGRLEHDFDDLLVVLYCLKEICEAFFHPFLALVFCKLQWYENKINPEFVLRHH